MVWLEYREVHPDGYGYSRFCKLYRLWAKKLDPPMRHEHKAGERMFVDYAGQTMAVVDPENGEIREAHIFIAVLGASNYSYAEAHWARISRTGSPDTLPLSNTLLACRKS